MYGSTVRLLMQIFSPAGQRLITVFTSGATRRSTSVNSGSPLQVNCFKPAGSATLFNLAKSASFRDVRALAGGGVQ
jgi:hypothetical protein